ncbi:uncharacterized protein LOC116608277 [Nematostella vectensis]|uniref:uncharacterized protein LOC125572185 n=1 Tax=Nematostella vectensis TaxID=45351 RepID=UPI002076ED5A|nr:uncharacterized protein LOC125572185 [Nematostella vectensis]XP_048588835.1 uncharacterized protein LOC116608277 [Nematostella vectensis]
MFSKENILTSSIMLYLDDFLEEEDVIRVILEQNRKNPAIPHENYSRIEETLGDMSEAELKAEFRFGRGEIDLLLEALQIPESFNCINGTVSSGLEGLLMFLRRFAYPCRLGDMIPRFGRSIPELSLILSEVTDFIVNTHGHLLLDLNQPWLQPFQLESFARAISRKGAALDNCWGFVDGTVRPICRPGEHQRIMYNGHKRVHGIKFQSVVAPNGLIANLFGPVEGKRHDARMLQMSGLLHQLQQYSVDQARQPLCIYGDPAYPLRVQLQAPYKHAHLTADQEAFNSSMSKV